jgi:multidrug resistance efflux pump
MSNIIEPSDDHQFANGQSPRDLRDNRDTTPHNGLEALRSDSDADIERRIESPDRVEGDHGASDGGSSFRRIGKRLVLVALLAFALAAVAPFAWNYLQSYESTDDAQIDGHIDPLSSRINGTVIKVHAEDNDRVKAGELLVEIDPRDYQVAVENAAASLAVVEQVVKAAQQNYDLSAANLANSSTKA